MSNFVRVLLVAVMLAIPATASGQSASGQGEQPAPGAMRRAALEEEVVRLRALVQGGAVIPARPAGCTSAESRGFDFWLGEWDVSPGQSSVIIAESTITLHDQGCVIIEHWRPFRSAHGHSLNIYDATDGKWHQTWAAASGVRTEYAGALDGEGVMRLDNLTPQPGAPATRERMNFQSLDDNSVRQWGESFDEAEQRWVLTWSFVYRRRMTH